MFIGHEAIARDMKKLADSEALGQSYIFFGPPGVGKKLFALHLAGYLEAGVFDASAVPTESTVIDAGKEGSIGIDSVRGIKNFLWQMPSRGKRRIVIVDDAFKMTTEAQNALLKITEEPPRSAMLILITDDLEKLLPTIQSRFQKLYFPPVAKSSIKKWLVKEGVSDKEAEVAAERTLGSPGLALRLVNDESLKTMVGEAVKLIKAPPSERKTIIKDLIDDDFDFDKFLLALTISIVPVEPRHYAFWHQIQELRRDASDYNINPRLQLTALCDVLR